MEFVVYGEKNRNNTRVREYIPVLLKRSDRRIEARIPVVVESSPKNIVRFRKGKTPVTERVVPLVRGAAVPLRSDSLVLQTTRIEGLHPPSQTAPDGWLQSQSVDPNNRYPDSNGYYPNVGDGGSTTPSSIKPIYGAPNQGWGCQAGPWGSQGGGGYRPPVQPPGSANYPSQGSRPSQGGGYPNSYPPTNGQYPAQYPSTHGGYPSTPNQGGYYPHTPQGGQGGYPSSQGGQGGYPHTQGGQGGYPSSQGGQGGFPHSQGGQGGYPNTQGGQGGYPSSQGGPNGWSGSQWPQSTWSSGSNSGGPWNGKQKGRWVPCEPFDLTERDGRRRSSPGCPQPSQVSNSATFDPPATPASKVDDKTLFTEIPRDVEEISP